MVITDKEGVFHNDLDGFIASLNQTAKRISRFRNMPKGRLTIVINGRMKARDLFDISTWLKRKIPYWKARSGDAVTVSFEMDDRDTVLLAAPAEDDEKDTINDGDDESEEIDDEDDDEDDVCSEKNMDHPTGELLAASSIDTYRFLEPYRNYIAALANKISDLLDLKKSIVRRALEGEIMATLLNKTAVKEVDYDDVDAVRDLYNKILRQASLFSGVGTASVRTIAEAEDLIVHHNHSYFNLIHGGKNQGGEYHGAEYHGGEGHREEA